MLIIIMLSLTFSPFLASLYLLAPPSSLRPKETNNYLKRVAAVAARLGIKADSLDYAIECGIFGNDFSKLPIQKIKELFFNAVTSFDALIEVAERYKILNRERFLLCMDVSVIMSDPPAFLNKDVERVHEFKKNLEGVCTALYLLQCTQGKGLRELSESVTVSTVSEDDKSAMVCEKLPEIVDFSLIRTYLSDGVLSLFKIKSPIAYIDIQRMTAAVHCFYAESCGCESCLSFDFVHFSFVCEKLGVPLDVLKRIGVMSDDVPGVLYHQIKQVEEELHAALVPEKQVQDLVKSYNVTNLASLCKHLKISLILNQRLLKDDFDKLEQFADFIASNGMNDVLALIFPRQYFRFNDSKEDVSEQMLGLLGILVFPIHGKPSVLKTDLMKLKHVVTCCFAANHGLNCCLSMINDDVEATPVRAPVQAPVEAPVASSRRKHRRKKALTDHQLERLFSSKSPEHEHVKPDVKKPIQVVAHEDSESDDEDLLTRMVSLKVPCSASNVLVAVPPSGRKVVVPKVIGVVPEVVVSKVSEVAVPKVAMPPSVSLSAPTINLMSGMKDGETALAFLERSNKGANCCVCDRRVPKKKGLKVVPLNPEDPVVHCDYHEVCAPCAEKAVMNGCSKCEQTVIQL